MCIIISFGLYLCLILCPQWASMSEKEKAVYFTEAERRKQIHSQQNPGWSYKMNYVGTYRPHTIYSDSAEFCFL